MILCFTPSFPFAEKSPSVIAFTPPSPGISIITPSISVEETRVQRWENDPVGAGLFSYLVYLCLAGQVREKTDLSPFGTYFSVWEREIGNRNGGGCSLHTEDSGEAEAPLQTSHLSVLMGTR